jgi:uncharacterized protein (TIGR00251 family)
MRGHEVVVEHRDGAVLSIVATPKAKTSSVGPVEGDALRVRVTAAAADGAANEAIVGLLSQAASLPRSRLTIVAGQTARRKRVYFAGVSPSELRRRLGIDVGPTETTGR